MNYFISNREVEEIANALALQVRRKSKNKRVDVDAAAAYLGLNIRYETFAEKDCDEIGFTGDGETPLYIMRNNQKTRIVFAKNTIVLDKILLRKNEENRRRFTLAHEIGHIVLNQADPLKSPACYHRLYDSERTYSISELRERMTFDECQANTFAAMLLMPRETVVEVVRKNFHLKRVRVFGESVLLPEDKLTMRRISDQLGVSYTALLIQLQTYGLIERCDFSEYFERISDEKDE